MPYLETPANVLRKPMGANWRINPIHFLARSLCFCHLCQFPKTPELVNSLFPTTDNTTFAGDGLLCALDQVNIEWNRDFILTSNGIGTGDFTMAVFCVTSIVSAVAQHAFAQKNDAAGSPYAQVFIGLNTGSNGGASSGTAAFFTANGAGSSAVTTNSAVDTLPHCWVGVRDAGYMSLYKDGKLISGPTSRTVRDISDGTRYFAIGSRGNGTTESLIGTVYAALAWNRALLGHEVRHLNSNLYGTPILPFLV